jgi:hypothetical protein
MVGHGSGLGGLRRSFEQTKGTKWWMDGTNKNCLHTMKEMLPEL